MGTMMTNSKFIARLCLAAACLLTATNAGKVVIRTRDYDTKRVASPQDAIDHIKSQFIERYGMGVYVSFKHRPDVQTVDVFAGVKATSLGYSTRGDANELRD